MATSPLQHNESDCDDRDALFAAIARAWSKETSMEPSRWSEENRAWGQCAVTALVVQDFLGGDLVRGQIHDASHYWNRIASGEEVDLTASQFSISPNLTNVTLRNREVVLENDHTRARYEKLLAMVKELLGRRPKSPVSHQRSQLKQRLDRSLA
jgi:hypothetical protein